MQFPDSSEQAAHRAIAGFLTRQVTARQLDVDALTRALRRAQDAVSEFASTGQLDTAHAADVLAASAERVTDLDAGLIAGTATQEQLQQARQEHAALLTWLTEHGHSVATPARLRLVRPAED